MTPRATEGLFARVRTELGARAEELLSAHPAQGPIQMLNLLKFVPDGGADDYAAYSAANLPLVEHFGLEVVTAATPAEALIGERYWDLVLIVGYPSRQVFVDMLNTSLYAANEPLRTRSVQDSQLHVMDPVSG